MPARPETHYAKTTDGVHIAYQVVGDGPLDLVYVPSWWSNVDAQWDYPPLASFLRRVASFSRLICFDKRGVGCSDPVPLASLPTLEEWIDDVSVVLDAVGSSRCALFGSLGGGLMCLLFAATYPERVSALVLHNAYASWTKTPGHPVGASKAEAEAFAAALVRDWGSGSLAHVGQTGNQNSAELARYNRLSASPGTVAALLAMTMGVDLHAVLPTVGAPTLVVTQPSTRMPIETSHYLRDHISGARLVEVPAGGPLRSGLWDEPARLLDQVEEFLTGAPPQPEPDRVLATVLFTDIVGSTELASALGDKEWHDLLERYRAMVREHLRRFRGKEINTRGDDFLATFDGPARAIRCALAITEATKALGLEVRTGLHTGEVESMGEDIGGIAVHIGARVSAMSGAGEVVVSRTVVDLVAGSGITFEDRGEHELKGVPGTWRLFTVEG